MEGFVRLQTGENEKLEIRDTKHEEAYSGKYNGKLEIRL